MNISLRWVVDHLENSTFNSIDVDALVAAFNAKVAEIEHVAHCALPADLFIAGRVTAHDGTGVTLHVAESNRTYTLSPRTDLPKKIAANAAFLLALDGDQPRWVTLRELGLDKDGLLPALHIADADLSGDWRAQWEADDIILDIDNKSITHRPDMWGHRGFAREIAALLDTALKDEKPFLANLPIVHESDGVTAGGQHDCSLQNKAPETCSTISGMVLPAINHLPCNVRAVSRFVKVGYRPINALVDLTNYVMGEWGHPMHAYDADKVANATLTVRMAHAGEELELLDDSVLALNENDMVIADTNKVLGLAGIMGGKHDSISDDTQSVLLEAACFHAATIRRTAARHKLRTESSQRFEKTLDPAIAPHALQRFVQLAVEWGVLKNMPTGTISVAGTPSTVSIITLSHAYLCDRLGFEVVPEQVKAILEKLLFAVEVEGADQTVIYHVTVPTYRATKDVTGPHDIVEEVARQYGFDNIVPAMPSLPAKASSIHPVLVVREMKQFLAYAAGMREQRNYAFYDEQVLSQLDWKTEQTLALQNPVSKNAYRLIDSLLPHLLHNVQENSADHDSCAFFEWGTVWPVESDEQYQLAGVWYEKRGGLDFYALKKQVVGVCARAGVPVTFVKADATDNQAWLDGTRAARVMHGKTVLGYFGRVSPLMVQRMGGLPETEVYGFFVNGTYLQSFKQPVFNASAVQRHQHSTFDVSVLVPLATTVADLETKIAALDDLITNVRLIDFFEKNEWNEHRSVALRVTLAHGNRSVSRDEIEQIRQTVIATLEAQGGTLRA